MAQVKDMIGDAAQPRGLLGYAVSPEEAEKWCAEMRRTLTLDLEERDVSLAVALLSHNLSEQPEIFIAAWELLSSAERTAWSRFIRYEAWLTEERRKREC
jgi:hypothetical protein